MVWEVCLFPFVVVLSCNAFQGALVINDGYGLHNQWTGCFYAVAPFPLLIIVHCVMIVMQFTLQSELVRVIFLWIWFQCDQNGTRFYIFISSLYACSIFLILFPSNPSAICGWKLIIGKGLIVRCITSKI